MGATEDYREARRRAEAMICFYRSVQTEYARRRADIEQERAQLEQRLQNLENDLQNAPERIAMYQRKIAKLDQEHQECVAPTPVARPSAGPRSKAAELLELKAQIARLESDLGVKG